MTSIDEETLSGNSRAGRPRTPRTIFLPVKSVGLGHFRFISLRNHIN